MLLIKERNLNTAKVDVVEGGQSEIELLMIFNMGSKHCEELILDLACIFYACPNGD